MSLNYSVARRRGAEFTYPQDVRNCTTCHQGNQATFYKDHARRRRLHGLPREHQVLPERPRREDRPPVLGVQVTDELQPSATRRPASTSNHAIPGDVPTAAQFGLHDHQRHQHGASDSSRWSRSA